MSFSRRQPLAVPAPGADSPRPPTPLAGWLLDNAQLVAGPNAGAIAGVVNASGASSYVYPEIAGYYLQWLAWRAARFGFDPDLARRAARVQAWLARWLTMDGPPTRVHPRGSPSDWRNDALFCFDAAMVLRGLGAATQAHLVEPDPAVIAGVSLQLGRLIAADGAFAACIRHPEAASLPDRWSTRRGPFLIKAAAGVLRAANVLPSVPASVRDAAERTLPTCIAMLADDPHREAHPLLYAFEGVLNLPRHRRFHDALPIVARHFDRLLDEAGSDGYLPETPGQASPEPERTDVLAQALRVGYLLTAHRPQQPPDRIALARMRQTLLRQIRAGSGVAFARGAPPGQWNVWATMFADQALAFAGTERDTDAWWRVDPLIV